MRLFLILAALTITSPSYSQTLGSTSGASSAINISNPASTTNRLITTPTVVPPGLAAAGVETCLGSASGGLSLMGGGLTFGSTKVDEGCTIRLLARQLYAFGLQKAAVALMCQDARVAIAMDDAGSPCPPPAEIRLSERRSSLPPLSYSREERPMPVTQAQQDLPPAQEVQAQQSVQEMPPFTPEDQPVFTRVSN